MASVGPRTLGADGRIRPHRPPPDPAHGSGAETPRARRRRGTAGGVKRKRATAGSTSPSRSPARAPRPPLALGARRRVRQGLLPLRRGHRPLRPRARRQAGTSSSAPHRPRCVTGWAAAWRRRVEAAARVPRSHRLIYGSTTGCSPPRPAPRDRHEGRPPLAVGEGPSARHARSCPSPSGVADVSREPLAVDVLSSGQTSAYPRARSTSSPREGRESRRSSR